MSSGLTGPLKLAPIFKAKVWGGRRLERLGKALPADEMIGESWEVCDLEATSASGGGGGAAQSVIVGGAHDGRTLRDAINEWGSALMGDAALTEGGAFPLLVKFLDAREHLSVQVHPSPGYAASHPGAHLKTECWYVLDAQAGEDGSPPVIYKGLKPGVTIDDLRESASAQTTPELLEAIEVAPGEMHDLPSGTIHALGAGVLVAEVQTPSDTTFRVYDWAKEYGREGRELHIEQTLACTSLERAPGSKRLERGQSRGVLVENAFYRVEEIMLGADERVALRHASGRHSCEVVMIVGGGGAICGEGAVLGETLVVPAVVDGDVVAGAEGMRALVASPR